MCFFVTGLFLKVHVPVSGVSSMKHRDDLKNGEVTSSSASITDVLESKLSWKKKFNSNEELRQTKRPGDLQDMENIVLFIKMRRLAWFGRV